MKNTRILSMFSTTVVLCGLLACNQAAQNEAEIVSQLENLEKVESNAANAAPPSAAAPGNDSAAWDSLFLAPRSGAGDSIALKNSANVPEIPAAEIPPPPPPQPPPADQGDSVKPITTCIAGTEGCPETVGNQLLHPNAVDSVSMSTLPMERSKFDTVTLDPNFIDAASLMTVGQYCENKLNECLQGYSGPPLGVCHGAFNACMESCSVRNEVCNLAHKGNCFHDNEVCLLEKQCRDKKTECVSGKTDTVQCEGDRIACNSRIEGHLANCASTKDQCLKNGGGSQECYWDFASCKERMSP